MMNAARYGESRNCLAYLLKRATFILDNGSTYKMIYDLMKKKMSSCLKIQTEKSEWNEHSNM